MVDCANGASYRVAPTALWELGAEVVALGVKPNGFNINKDCGSTAPQRLCEAVLEEGADIGIALDGDADRVIIADEKGNIIDGDQILALVAESWSQHERLSSPGVVATIMSNLGLEKFLESLSLSLARTSVGDRYVVEYMREHGLNVGGEQSGHIVLSDFTTTGDGLIAALQVLAVIQETGRSASQVCHLFDPYPQILENVRYGDCAPLENKTVREAIAHGEGTLGNAGRLVIRKSGTEPLIRVMAEGENETLVRQVVNDVVGALEQVANS